MAIIPQHIIQQIIDTARIEDVIGEFVHLKKYGSNYKGLSPFTDEKTPSFVVSPSKQIFKCFSTGISGRVTTFLMKNENFSFPEAIRWLADKYNIEIPNEKELSAEELAQLSEKESFYIINENVKKYFHDLLLENEEGKTYALSYLLERNISIEFIKKFQLGYCLSDGLALYNDLKSKAFNLTYCEKLGLIKKKENDTFYDFFKGRIMFPIHSANGKIAGFAGRIIGAEKKTAKYFNSPESSVYNKSEILYGLYFSKNEIIKKNECYLVEGYTDVISLHQAGIQNVVASSGTSLTKEQIKLISRYSKNITILYDGDNAGIKASFRGIDMILAENLNVKVVLFPDGEDPDSFSKKVSSSEFEQYLKENSRDFIHFKADLLLGNKDIETSEKIKVVNDIIESISLIPDKISREFYAKEIIKEYDLSKDTVFEIVDSKHNKRIHVSNPDNDVRVFFEDKKDKLLSLDDNYIHEELELIKYLVKYGNYILEFNSDDIKQNKNKITVTEFIINELIIDEMLFDNPINLKILSVIIENLENKIILNEDYFLNNSDNQIVELVSGFYISLHSISENWKKHKIFFNNEDENLEDLIQNAIYSFKIKKIKKLLIEIDEKLIELSDNDDNDDEIMMILDKKMNLEQVKIKLSKELGITILH